MPTIVSSSASSKSRYLLSGFSNTGKTTSFQTFIYGDYDYWSDEEHSLAAQHAAGQHMSIVVCPGETGSKSVPPNTEHITSYMFEASEGETTTDVKWSIAVLQQYESVIKQIEKGSKPEYLMVDGLHHLWSHCMNRTTGGEYLKGLSIGVEGNPYSSAKLYSQAHNAFAQYMSSLYVSPIHIIVGTTWEEWEAGSGDNPTATGALITAKRYLWPAIPGLMAKQIVGRFDARLSCQLQAKCLHGKACEDYCNNEPHFVWQFLPKGDVAGVGIKGLRRMTKQMRETPYIHQSYVALKELIEVCK